MESGGDGGRKEERGDGMLVRGREEKGRPTAKVGEGRARAATSLKQPKALVILALSIIKSRTCLLHLICNNI
jgi:hypothetical protein